VLGDIPRYVRHVRGTPRENFGVCAEKVDEHCFLFGVELGADPDLLAIVVAGAERDGLNRLSWLEVAGVSLRIWRLLGEALQVGDEGLGLGEGLSLLHALHVAFVRVALRGSDGDDPVGARHLKLEIRVVGDGHELGVARSPQYRVVGPSEPDHLECEGFLSEVGGSSEVDRQIDLPQGQDALSGDDPVKGRRTGPDRGQIDPQEPEGLGVDDVEAAASVHEDLGELSVADDGVDNERVSSWARHTVGVVALVEGDGLVGPVQVDWRRHLHRADLPALLLSAPSRGIRHLPTVDHETAMDLRELLCLVALLLVVALALAFFRRGPGLMEVAPEHDAFFKGVLDGALVIGA
jgi:hypothetical protein